MGKFTDFDLDLNVEKDTNTFKTNNGDRVPDTIVDCTIIISEIFCTKITKWPKCGIATNGCSASDMTDCDACRGARNEDDGNSMLRC